MATEPPHPEAHRTDCPRAAHRQTDCPREQAARCSRTDWPEEARHQTGWPRAREARQTDWPERAHHRQMATERPRQRATLQAREERRRATPPGARQTDPHQEEARQRAREQARHPARVREHWSPQTDPREPAVSTWPPSSRPSARHISGIAREHHARRSSCRQSRTLLRTTGNRSAFNTLGLRSSGDEGAPEHHSTAPIPS